MVFVYFSRRHHHRLTVIITVPQTTLDLGHGHQPYLVNCARPFDNSLRELLCGLAHTDSCGNVQSIYSGTNSHRRMYIVLKTFYGSRDKQQGLKGSFGMETKEFKRCCV
jgi:hypothetical protein